MGVSFLELVPLIWWFKRKLKGAHSLFFVGGLLNKDTPLCHFKGLEWEIRGAAGGGNLSFPRNLSIPPTFQLLSSFLVSLVCFNENLSLEICSHSFQGTNNANGGLWWCISVSMFGIDPKLGRL